MNTRRIFLIGMVGVGLLIGSSTAVAQTSTVYEWNDKLGRGVLNMVGSPVELARTIHIQTNTEGPAYGWTMGVVEGFSRGFIRFGAGVIDTLTCPFDFPKENKAPLLMPMYPWDEWDGPSL